MTIASRIAKLEQIAGTPDAILRQALADPELQFFRDWLDQLTDKQFDAIHPLLPRDLGGGGVPLSNQEQSELHRLMAETKGPAA